MKAIPNSSHWGNFTVDVESGKAKSINRYPVDVDTTPMLDSWLDVHDSSSRIARPSIRRGYLDNPDQNSGKNRGLEAFVEVPWDEALGIAASALRRTINKHGNESIYGGSYGWASAGRFHHAQSQIHRFLNQLGGYTASVNSYSAACAEVILPYIFGPAGAGLFNQSPSAEDIANHTQLLVCFGGMALKNTQVNPGGLGAHTASQQTALIKHAGVEVINFSPIYDDVSGELNSQWIASRPGSDTAIMLGLAHTLFINDWHDKDFLVTYCEGFEKFSAYLMGHSDGQVKDADWAAEISGCNVDTLREIAAKMARSRTLINLSLSVQRTEHGEQPYWAAAALAAMVGQVGLPGAGVGFGYGAMHNFGFNSRHLLSFKAAAFSQGVNPVKTFIPVAQFADMLLNPGGNYSYNGKQRVYPDIELVYWAGGNPYHHHQNLNRLRQAWARPQTIIVHDFAWTATARYADIVFPANTSIERNDLGVSSSDNYITPMRKAVSSYAESKSDYDIFCGLSKHLDCLDAFSEGKGEMQWVRHLYEQTVTNAQQHGIKLPNFEPFWEGGQLALAEQIERKKFFLEEFRRDPKENALRTPSGKIEIFSSTIAGYNYTDCGGHPMWFSKTNILGSERAELYPFHLVSNQPKTRLHSQMDRARTSLQNKIQQRERARMNPKDCDELGLEEGDIIEVYNDLGACLAGLEISDVVAEQIIELPTGAWYDPLDPAEANGLCVHGNPNVLTSDKGSSSLAQGAAAHSCLVNVRCFGGDLPPLTVDRPPKLLNRAK